MRRNYVGAGSVVAGILSAILALSACGSSSKSSSTSSSGGADQTVTVGVLLPLSGANASFGAEAKKGIETAIKMINSKHNSVAGFLGSGSGLTKHGGTKIKVDYADFASDSQEAATQVTKLITQDHVQLIMGALLSGATATASKVAETNQVPFLSPSATDPTLSERGFKYFFNANTNDTAIAKASLNFIGQVSKAHGDTLKKIALMVEDSQYGQNAAKNLKAAIAATSGTSLVANVSYPVGTPTMTSQLQQVKAAHPDVVIADTIGADAGTMLRDMNTIDLQMKLFLGRGGFEDADVIKNYDKLLNGLVTADLYSPDLAQSKPVAKEAQTIFQKDYNEPLNGTAARPMAGMLVAADVLNRAKEFTTKDIRSSLEATDMKSKDLPVSWNGVKFDPKTLTNTASTVLISQYQDGAFTTVYPADEAVAKLAYPFASFSSR